MEKVKNNLFDFAKDCKLRKNYMKGNKDFRAQRQVFATHKTGIIVIKA